MQRKFITGISVLVCLFILFQAPGMAQDKLRIGIVTAKSGPLAAAGKFQQNGFQLAAEEINQKGGVTVGGKKYELELVTYDTRCNPGEGASAMQRLTTVDQVPVILGELCSSVAMAEGPIAKSNKVPLILTVPTGPNITKEGNPYLFRVNANNYQLNLALSRLVAEQGWSPLSFIAWNNDAGRGGVNGMKELLPESFKIGYVGYFNVGEVDFYSHISNIRNANSKAVMLLMDEEPGALAIKQIKEVGLDVQLIGTLAMGSNRFLERGLKPEQLAGMVQYNAFPPNAKIPRIQNFSNRYREKFNEEAHGFAAQSYDGLYVAVDAIQRAGSVKDSEKIRQALAETDYEGVIGRIKFDSDGQASPPVYVTQWCTDGTRKIIFPSELKSSCGDG